MTLRRSGLAGGDEVAVVEAVVVHVFIKQSSAAPPH